MCGLAGLVLGKRNRSDAELERLTSLFTRLLVISRRRGPHATGVAWLNRDGEHRLFKRPLPAEAFVEHKVYPLMLAGVDRRTTVVLGHTRWRTRGDEQINRNNHPIRAGHVIGTHNGTIYNADALFRRYRLTRFAEVDSEVLFRLAARSVTRSGQIDTARYTDRLRHCRGQIAAVLVCRTDPGTILMLKGNNPLELRWNPRAQVVLYASDAAYLNAALAGERGWRELRVSPMTLLALRSEDLSQRSAIAFSFVGTVPDDALDVSRLRQPWLEDL